MRSTKIGEHLNNKSTQIAAGDPHDLSSCSKAGSNGWKEINTPNQPHPLNHGPIGPDGDQVLSHILRRLERHAACGRIEVVAEMVEDLARDYPYKTDLQDQLHELQRSAFRMKVASLSTRAYCAMEESRWGDAYQLLDAAKRIPIPPDRDGYEAAQIERGEFRVFRRDPTASGFAALCAKLSDIPRDELLEGLLAFSLRRAAELVDGVMTFMPTEASALKAALRDVRAATLRNDRPSTAEVIDQALLVLPEPLGAMMMDVAGLINARRFGSNLYDVTAFLCRSVTSMADVRSLREEFSLYLSSR